MTDIAIRGTTEPTTVALETLRGPGEILNYTGVAVGAIASEMARSDPLVAQLIRWSDSTKPPSRSGGLLDRDKYVPPDSVFGQIRTARDALDDDIVSGVAESTEALALNAVGVFCRNEDQQDAWNQYAGIIDLDSRLREAWQLLFTDSQFVCAMWWSNIELSLRGKTEAGLSRRKAFRLRMPTALTFLDTCKVVPVGNLMFNREMLAYHADPLEAAVFDRIIAKRDLGYDPGPRRTAMPMRVRSNPRASVRRFSTAYYDSGAPAHADFTLENDPIVERLIMRRYVPGPSEAAQLVHDCMPVDNLFLLDPVAVWRHTLTRPQFRRFARIRLKSVLELLDLKHQLRAADRAHLIGAANYLIVVTKGSDQYPAAPAEIANLRANVWTIASVPVIVGDHRLKVEIVTPKLDVTLDRDRHDTPDVRIHARLYQTFLPTGEAADDPVKLGKVIGRGLESRRRMLRRAFESKVFDPARRENVELTERAKMVFRPGSIQMAFDAGLASFVFDMRASNELSRQTAMDVIDVDQDDEAIMRQREADKYDDIFKTQQPHGTPNPVTVTRQGGRTGGGTRNGGGGAPGSGQGQEPRRRPRQPKRSKAELLARAKELREYGFRGYSGLDRDELAHMIAEFEGELEAALPPELEGGHDEEELGEDDD